VSDADIPWMTLALSEAEKGRGFVEPNPMVGALVVRDDRVAGIGHHARVGGPHAEVVALRKAGEAARGATLYVTLEPCCHFGKTPPCTEAILAAGVARVVAAMRDPFPRVNGGGLAVLRGAGIRVDLGLLTEAALELNAPYLKRLIAGLPYVTAKWAMTLDGKTAAASGDSHWISSSGSRARVHELRGRMDAILVGIGTAIADDPMLTARPPGPRTPTRIVLDSQARLPTTSRLVQSASEVPMIVAVNASAPAERKQALERLGCEVLSFPETEHVPIMDLLVELGRRSMTNLLVEGGGKVAGSFFDLGQIDQVEAYIAPIVEGGDHSQTPLRGKGVLRMGEALRLQCQTLDEVEGDLRIRGYFGHPWRSSLAEFGHEPPAVLP
jgi:diaminohydroxyphosphoribosylaminopyrimidine deaminase / 5-amino-6-(5-phosphoribosylamino)uracil reductase